MRSARDPFEGERFVDTGADEARIAHLHLLDVAQLGLRVRES